MGRLFWKFFFFVCLAQFSAILGVSAIFWLEHRQDEHRWQTRHSPPGADSGPNSGLMQGPEQLRPPPGPDPRQHPQGPGPGFGPPPHGAGPHLPVEPLAAALVASLIFAALLARYFSRPIRNLHRAFDAAAAGDLQARIGSAMGNRRDELADLGCDFDRMAAQVQSLVEGQRRLLHDVSHELRSPLARLQAAIDLARQQPERLELSMDRIEQESRRMDRLVGELLTLSRLEAGVAGRRVEEIEVAELLQGIVEDARFEAQARGVAVELRGDGAGLIDGDGELLHRAIENVVRNAIKHTPPGGEVTVATGLDESVGELWIAVRDAGPGVPDTELDAIFEPFFRGSQPRDTDGHGLGLAIARRVVQSLGGRIGAANRAEGGLCMEIFLPARVPVL